MQNLWVWVCPLWVSTLHPVVHCIYYTYLQDCQTCLYPVRYLFGLDRYYYYYLLSRILLFNKFWMEVIIGICLAGFPLIAFKLGGLLWNLNPKTILIWWRFIHQFIEYYSRFRYLFWLFLNLLFWDQCHSFADSYELILLALILVIFVNY